MNRPDRMHPLAPVALALLLGSSAAACTGSAEGRAHDLAERGDADYRLARESWLQALQSDPNERDALADYLRAQAWDSDSWRPAALAAAVSIEASQPGATAPLNRLQGLDPRHYLARRVALPEVARELQRAQLPAPVLVEHYLKLDALHTWPDQRAYGPAASAIDPRALRDSEQLALRKAILRSVGRSQHPVAVPFLRAVALDPQASVSLRSEAAEALGHTQSPAAAQALKALLDTDSEPALAQAALSGGAKLRTPDGLSLLRAGAAHPLAAIRHGAWTALGAFASPNAWHGIDETLAQQLRAGAAETLAEAFATSVDAAAATTLVEAIATADHATTWRAARAAAKDARLPDATRTAALRALRYQAIAAGRGAR